MMREEKKFEIYILQRQPLERRKKKEKLRKKKKVRQNKKFLQLEFEKHVSVSVQSDTVNNTEGK